MQRYCRLALPYLAAIGFAIVAGEIGRDWIDYDVVGRWPTIQQVLAHILFLQDVLGYESLSAGLWFVCITFQLTLVYVAGLFVRDVVMRRRRLGPRTSEPVADGFGLAAGGQFVVLL